MRARLAIGATVLTLLTGCAADPATAPAPTTSTTTAPPASSRSIPLTGGGTCDVTLGSTWDPPPGVGYDSLFGAGRSYGNGTLWVGGLGKDGVIEAGPARFLEEDGSVGMKFGWWRNARGQLTITGRRLDGPAPPLRASVPSGYGQGFQASGVSFPTEGCWEVIGELAGTTLTFVTLVKISP